MPRVTSHKTRQAILVLEGAVDPNILPEKLALFDEFGNPIALSGVYGVPTGGLAGRVLTKVTDDDYNMAWALVPSDLPVGGFADQVLTKVSGTDYDVAWEDVAGAGGAAETYDWFDNFQTDRLAEYSAVQDTLTGVSVASGVLKATTGNKFITPTVLLNKVINSVQTVKINKGVTAMGSTALMARWWNLNNQLFCVYSDTAITLWSNLNGVFTQRATVTVAAHPNSSARWFRLVCVDNDIIALLYSTDPEGAANPTILGKIEQNNISNLGSGEAHAFGPGVAGSNVLRINGSAADQSWDDYRIRVLARKP